MNYFQTLIAVADDCPVTTSVVPVERGGKKTVAVLQYELLAVSPHVYTQEDVLFEGWVQRQNLPRRSEAEVARQRTAFFARPRACLRASPLPKQYGWGLLFDQQGRVALCPMESEAYEQLLASNTVTVLKAPRSRRA